MRKSSAFLTTLVAASAITVAWRIGDIRAIEQQTVVVLPSSSPGVSEPATEPTIEPSAEASPSAQPTESSGTGSKPKPSKTSKPAAPVEKTVKSDVIEYKYGVLQISVTALDGKITNISVLQGETSNGRAAAYKTLTSELIKSQGQSYGNVSGATFTTEAFIRAYNSAVVKF